MSSSSSFSLSLGDEKKEMGMRRGNSIFERFDRRPMKVKILVALSLSILALIALKLSVKNDDYFFVAAETVHFAGIAILTYKLTTKRTCSGLSLKTQELTAIFLGVRVVLSFFLEADIHTVLDFLSLVSTVWVIYMMMFKLKPTYIKELDNLPRYYVLVPCGILSLLIHPFGTIISIKGSMWSFCVFLESVSVLPQLRMMQNAKMIEPITSHYVFALGIARFLSCAHWLFQLWERGRVYLMLVGHGYIWFPTAFLAEMVQTFILADFCYYYIKSLKDGQLVMRMPV